MLIAAKVRKEPEAPIAAPCTNDRNDTESGVYPVIVESWTADLTAPMSYGFLVKIRLKQLAEIAAEAYDSRATEKNTST